MKAKTLNFGAGIEAGTLFPKAEPTKDEEIERLKIEIQKRQSHVKDESGVCLTCKLEELLEEKKKSHSPPDTTETELIAEFMDNFAKSRGYLDKKHMLAHSDNAWLNISNKLEQAARNLMKKYKAIVLAEWIEGEKKRADILTTVNKKAISDAKQKTASAIFEFLNKLLAERAAEKQEQVRKLEESVAVHGEKQCWEEHDCLNEINNSIDEIFPDCAEPSGKKEKKV